MRIAVIQLLVTVCCSSCASVYISSLRNVPLLEKQGEFQGNASFGNGMNANAAFALTNHIGIAAGGLYADNRYQRYNNTYRIHKAAEIGLGYFKHTDQISFEVYSGFGVGSGYAQDSTFGWFLFNNSQLIAEGRYQKYYLQPTFAFNRTRIQMAITMRFTYLEFHDITITNNADPLQVSQKTFLMIEPSFTAKFFILQRIPSIFIFTQAGFNFADQKDHNERPLPYSILHYNFGLGIRLAKKE